MGKGVLGAAGITKAMVGDIPAVRLEAGGYVAAICPDLGANCFLLERDGASFLRIPPSFDTFRSERNIYGMPLLFPPNRVRDGAYRFQGRDYRLPINEPERGNHIHGFLSGTPFVLADERAAGDACEAIFSYEASAEAPYSSFPHAFRVSLAYSLGPEGLVQRLSVKNLGETDMPLGLGFHTAFNAAFLPGSRAVDYRLRLTVSRQIPLDPERFLPAGDEIADNELLRALRGDGLPPQGAAVSCHLRGVAPGSPAAAPGEARLTHLPSGRALVYRTDPRCLFWTLWNQGGDKGFICPEPQTWTIDAPNSPLPPEESGFAALAPGAETTLVSSLAEIGRA
ncbi:aldose 1-epimerase [bacterium]|nr:aldose 1-epimerase [bacterium]